MYVIIRNDLSNAQKAVQGAHAAIESARAFLNPDDEHPSVIMLIVKNKTNLRKALAELSPYIKIKEFYEPDIGNQMTAFATEPISGDLRKLLQKYQLLY